MKYQYKFNVYSMQIECKSNVNSKHIQCKFNTNSMQKEYKFNKKRVLFRKFIIISYDCNLFRKKKKTS